jgi:6-phosphogluconate dehydrogenase
MMMGGPEDSWQRLRPLLEAIAAKFDGDPCVARLGPDGAGHFVKTVHNGIEYADMQMMAEIYGLLRDGAGRSAGEIGALFETWSQGPLSGFLVETTALALSTTDPETRRPTVDVIRDAAGQKGTGRWTVIEALKLGQSASAIEAAVGARSWSSAIGMRAVAQERLPAEAQAFSGVDNDALQDALLAGRILSHAQGFDILSAASEANGWALDLSRIAEIWRAGCIIRSVLLDDIAEALKDGPTPGGLVLAPGLIAVLEGRVAGLRRVVSAAVTAGLPMPSLSAALAWYDTMRQARGTANLIQAQRDIFGAHGFERLDQSGKHHGSWRLTRD